MQCGGYCGYNDEKTVEKSSNSISLGVLGKKSRKDSLSKLENLII